MQFSFQLTTVHDAILGAVGRAIAAGYRTGDIFNAADSAAKKVGTSEMGDAIAALL
jgi:isocitrate dehydrogenase